MTHWLAHIPYMPTWTGWAHIERLAKGGTQW